MNPHNPDERNEESKAKEELDLMLRQWSDSNKIEAFNKALEYEYDFFREQPFHCSKRYLSSCVSCFVKGSVSIII